VKRTVQSTPLFRTLTVVANFIWANLMSAPTDRRTCTIRRTQVSLAMAQSSLSVVRIHLACMIFPHSSIQRTQHSAAALLSVCATRVCQIPTSALPLSNHSIPRMVARGIRALSGNVTASSFCRVGLSSHRHLLPRNV
jgi:hypothetical protein